MNIKNGFCALMIILGSSSSQLNSAADTINISSNSFFLSGEFIISPKEGYPVFVTVYPHEGKDGANSWGKGKALCSGWLTAESKITIESKYMLLTDHTNSRGVISTLFIEPGKGTEQEVCAGDSSCKFQALSCLIKNMKVDSFIIKFETKKVTRPVGNGHNGNAETKEIRLHAHFQQEDWDASHYSISFKRIIKDVTHAPTEQETVEESLPEVTKVQVALPVFDLESEEEQEEPEPHLVDELPEVKTEEELEVAHHKDKKKH